jgi:hypothetical protein
MFRSLLPAAGTVAGGLIGGPAGAAVGGGIGTLGSGLMERPRRQSTMPQQAAGFPTQQLPGGATAVQMPRFTPEQQTALTQMLQQGLGGLQQLPQAEFGPLRQQAMSQFQEDIVPGIAERFTAGGAGSQRSSAFQQAMGGAGAGLSERLAAMEQGFNLQRRGQEQSLLMNLLQGGMAPQFEYAGFPRQPGFGEEFTTGLAGTAGQALPGILEQLLKSYLGGQSPSLQLPQS